MKQFEIFSLESNEQQLILGGTETLSAIVIEDPLTAVSIQAVEDTALTLAGPSNLTLSTAGHRESDPGHGEEGDDSGVHIIEELLPVTGGTPTSP